MTVKLASHLHYGDIQRGFCPCCLNECYCIKMREGGRQFGFKWVGDRELAIFGEVIWDADRAVYWHMSIEPTLDMTDSEVYSHFLDDMNHLLSRCENQAQPEQHTTEEAPAAPEFEPTYEHGYIVGRAASGALWLEGWEHSEYDDGQCVYDTYPLKFYQLVESRQQVLQAGMELNAGETIKLIYVTGRGYISVDKREAEQAQAREAYECVEFGATRKPYTPPVIHQLCRIPIDPRSTVWDIHQSLDEFDINSLYDIYDFLRVVKSAGGNLDVLILMIGRDIARAFTTRKEAQS